MAQRPASQSAQLVKVREVIRAMEDDGWRLDHQTGSHRQFRHASKPGLVTAAGNLGAVVPLGTLGSILRQVGLKRSES